jgi:hypothetical protein
MHKSNLYTFLSSDIRPGVRFYVSYNLIYGMEFTSLFGFVMLMWIMILAEAAFLVLLVPLLDHILVRNGYSRLIVSSIEALISISSVVMLIFVLNRMKKIYIEKKLQL